MNRSKRLSSPQWYTVGWIAALDKELAAARAVLDEIHQKPENFEKHPKDSNNYAWGRIGEHNVVIASLAAGRYGTVSAAATALSMTSSLPHLRFGLMVGIGAGIPRLEDNIDIRLGDVVVSHPTGTSTGVVKYDLGKLTKGGTVHRTGCLNSPPEVLLNGLATLKAHHLMQESRISEILDEMIQRYPKLGNPGPDGAGAFVYQGKGYDRLFEASSIHEDASKRKRTGRQTDSSMSCPYCDPAKEIKRNGRSTKPEIHYGIIASGDSVVKDGISRDSILRRLDDKCICFEMEAAGLMNHFPCLVVRGICDYADAHKNDRWQNYAAAVAAAFAKELLEVMDGEDVERASTVAESVSRMGKQVLEIRSIANSTRHIVQDLSISDSVRKIKEWLHPPDPSTNYYKAIQKRHEGSGQWFLECEKFSRWRRSENSFLWLNAIPGCGKTVLSSTIIQSLKDDEHCGRALLYFYFDFNDTSKQSLENAVRSLIFQLYMKTDGARRYLDASYDSHKDKQPSMETLFNTFQSMLEETGEVWVVLDALDECNTRRNLETGGIVSWIKQCLSFPQSTIHIIATSRAEQDIDSDIRKWARDEDIISIKSQFISDDIAAYVHTMVRKHEGLERWHQQPEIQDEIESALIKNAQGMFRWVWCQLDALQWCLDRVSLRKALASLPKTLDQTYDRILENIPPEYDGHRKRILQFLTFAERPLRVEEVAHIIAVTLDGRPYFDSANRMPLPMEISKYCSSLVTVTSRGTSEPDGPVTEMQLAHFSVKEYLTSARLMRYPRSDFQEARARASIAKVCLAYLLELDHGDHLTRESLNRSFPLAHFAAKYWAANARLVQGIVDEDLNALVMQLFSSETACVTCYWLHSPDTPIYFASATKYSPLYYPSLEGLAHIVTALLDQGFDVNAEYGLRGFALAAAAATGRENVVRILLSRGASVSARDREFGKAALDLASCLDHGKIIKLLLDHGAGVNDPSGYNEYPLSSAARYGSQHAVKILLDHGADVNAVAGRECLSALMEAVSQNRDKVVQILIDHGADVNFKSSNGITCLQWASRDGYKKVVHILVNSGAKINVRGGEYGSALQAAAAEGHIEIVRVLLQHGAYLNAKGGKYGNARNAASEKGHEDIVEFLDNYRR